MARSLRILYHHRTLGDGAEGIHIREMVAAFRKLGHQVRVESLLGRQLDAQDQEKRNSAETQSDFPKNTRALGASRLTRFLPRVAYELGELAYNIVGRRRLRSAIAEFQPDLIYDRYNTFSDSALHSARNAGIPLFLEVNAPMVFERCQHDRGLVFRKLAAKYERQICSSASRVFAVSTPLRNYLIQERCVREENIFVLPNAADPAVLTKWKTNEEMLALRRRFGVPSDATIVGFTGIFRPWHGIEMLCSAFQKAKIIHPRAHLLLVGDGPCESEIRGLVQQLKISDCTTFTGRVRHADIVDYLRIIDIAVSPKTTFYASPMKIPEYMAVSIPVIAPNSPNVRDLITHDSEGLLFPDGSEEGLCDALVSLIQSPQKRVYLGDSARRRVETDLNWYHNAEIIVDTLLKKSLHEN